MESKKKTILVTGAAGFIGAALSERLLSEGASRVIGTDNLNDYYDPALKAGRLSAVSATAKRTPGEWAFIRGDVADKSFLLRIFEAEKPDLVVHLAAKAGVRHSIECPDEYIRSNIIGFYNVLEACRTYPVRHLVYASSSSVYGERDGESLSVQDRTDSPVSLYAATKKSDEVMAYAYSLLYGIPATGLRFFTVYGPWGRPDMAYWRFAEALSSGRSIDLYNKGESLRDYTYIGDAVEGIVRVLQAPPKESPLHALYNIGGGSPVRLQDFVQILTEEMQACGLLPQDFRLREHAILRDRQPGDVTATCADTETLRRNFGYEPKTDLRDGLRAFVRWFAVWKRGNFPHPRRTAVLDDILVVKPSDSDG